MLQAGGGFLAAFGLLRLPALASDVVDIRMHGNADGAHVWFDPIGLRIQPGQTVRWTNGDAGNSHTATAYHPSLFDRPRRIPTKARPWDSDYLLPNETFSVTLTVPGIYDFYCIPHEHAGMVGRIVVGDPAENDWDLAMPQNPESEGALPQIALDNFPAVDEIMKKGIVRRA
ncbi:plastocyanin [Pseudaminobacter salicylatoxidans]|uniref:Plastocyanin n=1 Tax=Pseudaminobacter salicylatoxidans TaxID=93369 RepID=A0A316BZJ9_PSESE|nr:plastocyanin/azurin family copper-binding protein [Pseudaminobacter salicylatoxidans]PWJ80506.1 plastocyanin [Pseudaminobacter salicylatoxidans]